jgi:hypothetical protein
MLKIKISKSILRNEKSLVALHSQTETRLTEGWQKVLKKVTKGTTVRGREIGSNPRVHQVGLVKVLT